MQRYKVYFIWKLLYIFRVAPPPIIRTGNNFIYSIWYLSHRIICGYHGREGWGSHASHFLSAAETRNLRNA